MHYDKLLFSWELFLGGIKPSFQALRAFSGSLSSGETKPFTVRAVDLETPRRHPSRRVYRLFQRGLAEETQPERGHTNELRSQTESKEESLLVGSVPFSLLSGLPRREQFQPHTPTATETRLGFLCRDGLQPLRP